MTGNGIPQVAQDVDSKWRSTDVAFKDKYDFSSFHLKESVLTGLTRSGFVKPSPVQLAAIPLGRCGLDLVIQAKSGTGKTCVFTVIALEMVDITCKACQVLIIGPTREIAQQISQVITSIGRNVQGLSCRTFIGGKKVKDDREALKRCHIAVATPGRVKSLLELGLLKTQSIRLLILDEADKLMDNKFQGQVNDIYHHLPENKQMIAASATYTQELTQFIAKYMRTPSFVQLDLENPALLGIDQYYLVTAREAISDLTFGHKLEAVSQIINSVSFSQCIIFCNYQSRARLLRDNLMSSGWPTEYISGDMEQKDREKSLLKLKEIKCRILVSTDLIARGIDAEGVNLVINMDLASDTETYLHRIGRAGRFGSRGLAITLVTRGFEVDTMLKAKKESTLNLKLLPDLRKTDLWGSGLKQNTTNLTELLLNRSRDEKPLLGKRKYKTYKQLGESYERLKSVGEKEDATDRNIFRVADEVLSAKLGVSVEQFRCLRSKLHVNCCQSEEEDEGRRLRRLDHSVDSSEGSVVSLDSSVSTASDSYLLSSSSNGGSEEDSSFDSSTESDYDSLSEPDAVIAESGLAVEQRTSNWYEAILPPVGRVLDLPEFENWLISHRNHWNLMLNLLPEDAN